ncbi:MDR family NADP-dependent oxidoreductase [Actinomadura parmotrematis]|uniref:NADP-dependent oxidoreductase n=1 Tax=Actinomadura parmotrematis TaxID=2864039 RepID=A0ABS7FMX6_9ACTN|nr:NADP-dependent oxidoreductase [Actinomadura parmotrematis]MBW8481585.1 NADP-dependent oxidoreductase [Actinomadura parmotrematis]
MPGPSTTHEIRLAALPTGLPGAEHFTVAEAAAPAPPPGGLLVRNRWFQVFPAIRSLLGDGVPGAPLPPLRPGDPLPGAAVGEVVEAPDGAGARPGDLVLHWLGWREHAAVPAGAWIPLGDELPDPAAHLSSGLTAYAALTRTAPVRPGETVLVTGGAGAVGSMAGRIARLLGAGRVLGTTRSAWKAARMTGELGYDAALLPGEPLDGGVDVVLDTVGGAQLRAAVDAARPGARVALVGTLAGQLAPGLPGTTGPVELDAHQLVLKEITLRGVTGSAQEARAEWLGRFGAWLRSGDIAFPHTRVRGLDAAPRALQDLIGGRHVGAVLAEV